MPHVRSSDEISLLIAGQPKFIWAMDNLRCTIMIDSLDREGDGVMRRTKRLPVAFPRNNNHTVMRAYFSELNQLIGNVKSNCKRT